jgi:ribosomal protein S18 acetylase RimI-like enzyme
MNNTSNVHLRDARPDEREAIRELTLAAYAEYAESMQPSAWAALHEVLLAALSSSEPAERIVAEWQSPARSVRGGELVGSVMLYLPGASAYGNIAQSDDIPEIRLLAVAPAARGSGVATALIEECLRRARQSGAAEVGLHSSASMRVAIQVYERMGFTRVPAGDFQPPGAELVMAYRRRLDPR